MQRNGRSFVGFTSSLAFQYSVIFIVRSKTFQTTPPLSDLSSFLYLSFPGLWMLARPCNLGRLISKRSASTTRCRSMSAPEPLVRSGHPGEAVGTRSLPLPRACRRAARLIAHPGDLPLSRRPPPVSALWNHTHRADGHATPVATNRGERGRPAGGFCTRPPAGNTAPAG